MGNNSSKWQKTKSDSDKTQITWTHLLKADGSDLWKHRQTVLDQINNKNKNKNENNKGLIHLQCYPDNWQKQVCVIANVSTFEEMESKDGMCKFELKSNSAMTDRVGSDWERQRKIITGDNGVLSKIKMLAINAAKQINFDLLIIQNNHNDNKMEAIIDLKGVATEAAREWMIRVFAGWYDTVLANYFLNHWLQLRAPAKYSDWDKQTETGNEFAWYLRELLQSHKNEKNDKNDENDSKSESNNDSKNDNKYNGGLIYSFFESNLSEHEMIDNCVNAMVAGFETTMSCIFWTLWNLSKNNIKNNSENNKNTMDKINEYRKEKEEIKDESQLNEMEEKQYDLLGYIKTESINGRLVTLNGLSYLGRALIETVRVYPPVWSLSRKWPYSKNSKNSKNSKEKDKVVISCKLDIPMCNNGVNREWNPDNIDSNKIRLTSWGVGKRTCPAGTAALIGAYIILDKFIQTFDEWTEYKVNNAIDTSYLAPTLNTQGPQMFNVKFNKIYVQNMKK